MNDGDQVAPLWVKIGVVAGIVSALCAAIALHQSSGSNNGGASSLPSSGTTSAAVTAARSADLPAATASEFVSTLNQTAGDRPNEQGTLTFGNQTLPGSMQYHVDWADNQKRATFALPARYSTFSATVGVISNGCSNALDVQFEVVAGDNVVGQAVASQLSPQTISYPIIGATSITLRIHYLTAACASDAIWGSAKLSP